MKKSLVISTIATVLVVVVALTTATFAWFATSDTTAVSNEFTINSGGGDFRIFPFEVDPGEFSATPSYDLDLMGNLGTYTYDAATMGNGLDSTDSLNNPLVPTAKLTGMGSAGNTLPTIDFAYGLAAGTQVNYQSKSDRPIAARFMLDTTVGASTNLVITAKVTQQDPTWAGEQAAKNIKFLLIGESANESATAQSFVFGTDYGYANNLADVQVPVEAPIAGSYTPVTIETDYAGGANNIVSAADFSGASTTNLSTGFTQESDTIVMSTGTFVYCTLYIWFDGQNMTEAAGGSSISFELSFDQPELP